MTNGIRIPVGADLSTLNQDLNKFGQDAKRVLNSLGGSATIDTTAATKSLEDLEKTIEQVNKALAGTSSNEVGSKTLDSLSDGLEEAVKNANALSNAMGGAGSKTASGMAKTVAETRKLLADLEKAKKLQATLAKQGHTLSTWQAGELEKDFAYMRDNATGAAKKRLGQFGSLNSLSSNWRSLASNEMAARRHYNDVLRQLGLSAPGGAPTPASEQGGFAKFMMQSMRRAGAGIFHAATPGGGVGAAIAQGAVADAAAGPGIMSMGGGGRLLAGGALALGAYGAIKGVSAIAGKVSSSEEEQTAYSDLLRQMGATTSTFEDLRSSVRSAAQGLDLSYADGAKLAQAYVRGAGIDGLSGQQLTGEMRTAGGFGRVLGLDPDAGMGIMGTLRHNKVSKDNADNRRFAMMIGEGIAKAGVFSKADDVLSAVASYTQVATRASLNPANTEGYFGAMSNLMGMRQAGLDPAGVGQMLGTVDQSFRNPHGEAQRNFLLGALQNSMPGMNAVDMGFMQDAGMFATAGKVFGKGSAAYGAADEATRRRYDGYASQGNNKTFYDMAMGNMAGMGGDDQRKNMMGLFGLNDSQAAALQKATKANGGNLSQTVSRLGAMYGVDPTKLGDTSLRHMLEVEYGDPSKLQQKAKWMASQELSATERTQLEGAMKNPGEGNSNLKSVLVQLGATRNMEQNEGDDSRRNTANLSNMASDMATKLIPITNAIREAVMAIANKMTGGAFKDKWGNSDKLNSELQGQMEGRTDPTSRRRTIAHFLQRVNENEGDYTPELRTKLQAMYDEAAEAAPIDGNGGNMPSSRASIKDKDLQAMAKQIAEPSKYDSIFKASAAKYGVDWRDVKQLGVQESRLQKFAVNTNENGTKDIGIMQHNSRYAGERGLTDANMFDPEANIDAGAKLWAGLLKANKGNVASAFKQYNGSGPRAEQYAANAMKLREAARAAEAAPGAFRAAPANPKYDPSKPYGVGDAWDEISNKVMGTKLPAGAPTSQKPDQASLRLQGDFRLFDQQGQRELASPIEVAGITAPRAAGMRA